MQGKDAVFSFWSATRPLAEYNCLQSAHVATTTMAVVAAAARQHIIYTAKNERNNSRSRRRKYQTEITNETSKAFELS